MTKHALYCCIVLVFGVILLEAAPIRVYVSADEGDDANNGTDVSAPVRSLQRAQQIARVVKQNSTEGVEVLLAGGDYSLNQTFTFSSQDSGVSPANKIIWRGDRHKKVRLIGGVVIPTSSFSAVTNQTILNRLKPAARNSIVAVSLSSLGINDLGTLLSRGSGNSNSAMEVFVDGIPLTLARYPNTGWLKVASAPDGAQGTRITYNDTEPELWSSEEEVWGMGYWYWDWSSISSRVTNINTSTKTITFQSFGSYGVRANQRYYMYNLFSELDQAGEYYIDRSSHILYMWPPYTFNTTSTIMVSMINDGISANGLSNVVFENFAVHATRGYGIRSGNGNNITFRNLDILGIGSLGISAVGTNYTIDSCNVMYTGDGGFSVSGGNRNTLTPSGTVVNNNHIWNVNRWAFTYHPSVNVNGVGVTVRHNKMYDTPHNVILFGGNDHVFEYNLIYNAVTDTGDAGAVYAGRDWTLRGHVIRYNFFYDINGPGAGGTMAIYMDDQMSTVNVTGNVFYNTDRAIMLGGGRDHFVGNNLFVNCSRSDIYIDARGIGVCGPQNNATLYDRLVAVPYKQEPWSSRYPELVNILNDEPHVPKGNVFRTNVHYGPRAHELCNTNTLTPLVQINNTIARNWTSSDFVNASSLNFQLVNNHPAYSQGFQRIPFEEIGLTGPTGIIIDMCYEVTCPSNSQCDVVTGNCVCEDGYEKSSQDTCEVIQENEASVMLSSTVALLMSMCFVLAA